jgi:hypothetical protein
MYHFPLPELNQYLNRYFETYLQDGAIKNLRSTIDWEEENATDYPDYMLTINKNPSEIVRKLMARPVAYNFPYPYPDTRSIGLSSDYSRMRYTYFEAYYFSEATNKAGFAVVPDDAKVEVDIISFPKFEHNRKNVKFSSINVKAKEISQYGKDAKFSNLKAGDALYSEFFPNEQQYKLNIIFVNVPILGNPKAFSIIRNSNQWKSAMRPIDNFIEHYTPLEFINNSVCYARDCSSFSRINHYTIQIPLPCEPHSLDDVFVLKVQEQVSARIKQISDFLAPYESDYEAIKEATRSKAIKEVETIVKAYTSEKEAKREREKRMNHLQGLLGGF